MAAAQLDLLLEQGADFERILTFKDENYEPIDLTGFTFRSKIAEKAGPDGKQIAKFTFELLNQNGDTRGQVAMRLTAEETANLPSEPQRTAIRINKKLTYDVERVSPDGKVARVMYGLCEVSPEVTIGD